MSRVQGLAREIVQDLDIAVILTRHPAAHPDVVNPDIAHSIALAYSISSALRRTLALELAGLRIPSHATAHDLDHIAGDLGDHGLHLDGHDLTAVLGHATTCASEIEGSMAALAAVPARNTALPATALITAS